MIAGKHINMHRENNYLHNSLGEWTPNINDDPTLKKVEHKATFSF